MGRIVGVVWVLGLLGGMPGATARAEMGSLIGGVLLGASVMRGEAEDGASGAAGATPVGPLRGGAWALGHRARPLQLSEGAMSGEALEDVMAAVVRELGPSLFGGRAEGTLFAPVLRWDGGDGLALIGRIPAEKLRHLIATAEAGSKGYDAVHHGAATGTPRRPTQMSLAQIRQWIAATPGQNHAIGRYQIIPKTLEHIVDALGISGDAVFSPRLQDRMADFLLEQAGYSAFLGGDLSRVGFMNNLARIWAGLPNSSGQSHYHGYAGNRAVISWARFDAAMTEIFPS
ncbi:lysozyme family protein [Pseudooceanicola algae]|uniref:Uncharacterized protein n=1 Tax=Pseudooceanicola algae TaxID=1537215 RepID=A0A418SIX8_9RHOB|nr:hypothetical protein [Pseudooceanicola algae]QPM91946.1 hypothetical protein PSAL_032080 [Pseudooceanicola algae]